MKKLILCVFLCLCGCEVQVGNNPDQCTQQCYQEQKNELIRNSVTYLDLPEEYRVKNYAGGSCVHASLETLFYWQGLDEWARWWRKTYSGGEYADRCHERLDAAGIRFAYRKEKDWEFLQKCIDLRLGCAVNWPTNHMVTCVGIDKDNVYILDNNRVDKILRVSRSEFSRSWTGWSVTIVYTPPPPKPYSLEE